MNHLHTPVNVVILDENSQELLIERLEPAGHLQSQIHWHADPSMPIKRVNLEFWSTPLSIKHVYDVPLNQACRFDVDHIHHGFMDLFQLEVRYECQDRLLSLRTQA